MTTFEHLGLSKGLLKALTELKFEIPTEIQKRTIPILLNEPKDFLGLAQTGTGKTAAFGLPLLEQIDPTLKVIQALVLVPTRELCQQVAEQFFQYSKYLPKVSVLAVYGGANISKQITALRKTHQIIIATPGRLIDLIERKVIHLNKLRYIVLDEADEMLNMGFKDELERILVVTPDEKITWLFSATMPQEIKKIVKKYMAEPIEVKTNVNNEINNNIEHQFVVVKTARKTEALLRLLDLNPNMRGLVFCRTKRETQSLAEELMKKNYRADALHGDMSQAQRDRVMKLFRVHHLQVLIATDVAARGIDVNDLTHVFHFTLPDDNLYYTHRSGRTARAGKKGISISFVNTREGFKIQRLEKQLKISFKKIEVPATTEIAEARITNWCVQISALDTKENINDTLFQKVQEIFKDCSKEQMIKKLLENELRKLNLGQMHENKPEKLEFIHEKKNQGRRRERRNQNPISTIRKERKSNKYASNEKNTRFFINIGSRDKMNKREMVEFICSITKFSRKEIGNIDVKKSFSFFEVWSKAEKNTTQEIANVFLDNGREIKIHREH